MPTSTAHRALPLPEGTDVPDVPLWLTALADALDFDMHVITTNPRPAAGTLGRVHLLAGVWSLDTGAAWVNLPVGGPYLPTAGGALTGDLDLGGNDLVGAIVNEDRSKVTTVGAAGAARTLDAAVSPVHDVTLDQNVTFTFAGVDGDHLTLALRQPGAVKTVAWPATVDWAGLVLPVQRASTTVVYRFVRINGRWLGEFVDAARPAGHYDTVAQTAVVGLVGAGGADFPGLTQTITPPAANRATFVTFGVYVDTDTGGTATAGAEIELLVDGAVVKSWDVPIHSQVEAPFAAGYTLENLTVAAHVIKLRLKMQFGTTTVQSINGGTRIGWLTIADTGLAA